MKTPDEIKKGLEHCIKTGMACHICNYKVRCLKVVRGKPVMQDALALIQQLEAELEASKRERKAMMLDFQTCVKRTRKVCFVCGNKGKPICNMCEGCDVFEWRGVCPENTGVSPDA